MTELSEPIDPSSSATTVILQQDENSNLLTLDEYISKALPYHLQRQLQLTAISKTQGWSFTQGLLLGQLSVIIVIAFFIKFFVFSDAKSSSESLKDSKKIPILKNKDTNLARAGSLSGDSPDAYNVSVNSILEKTYYNVETHSPETLDWFNVLVAQTINQFRQEALTSDNIVNSLNEFLDNAQLPDYLDKIKIKELDIGDDFPIFSNCRIKKNPSNINNLQAKIDVDLSDTLTIGIETSLLLNSPKPLTASLPVQLSVSIVRFSACLTVSLISIGEDDDFLKDDQGNGTALMFSFSPDFRLNFSINSLIGARSKLENVPKIGNLIENQLKRWFIERCVEPRFQVVRMPSLWPTRKNVREPVNEDEE